MPPVITGGALVIPRALVCRLTGKAVPAEDADRKAVELAAMNAVMEIERSLGYQPRDVSAENRGYDIESYIPERLRDRADGNHLRFLEVKGRRKGADFVTVTHNEVKTALSSGDRYILAIVEVDGEQTHTIYLKQPFENRMDFAEDSGNYNIQRLIAHAEILYPG